MAALDDSPRPGKEPEITVPARAWLVSLACQKAKEVGYPHELWTTRLLARHSREHGPAAGHASLARIAQGTVCKLLAEQELKPHKVRYYLERRDPEFEAKMSEVLCVYQEVAILRAAEANAAEGASEAEAAAVEQTAPNVAFVSYDEKPGIQAISNTAPDLPPVAGKHACVARDHEYKRHGHVEPAGGDRPAYRTGSCLRRRPPPLARVHRLSQEARCGLRRRYRDQGHPGQSFGACVEGNQEWLAAQREGRFSFVFTPKHGSWLNLVEGFFSKMARSVLRRIRVASKAELKQRIMAYLDDLNRQPVVHTWSYKITLPAR